jgi:hypothetical protein
MLPAVRTLRTRRKLEARAVRIGHVQTGLRQLDAAGVGLASRGPRYDLQAVGVLSIARGRSAGQGGGFGGAAVCKGPQTLVQGLEQARAVFACASAGIEFHAFFAVPGVAGLDLALRRLHGDSVHRVAALASALAVTTLAERDTSGKRGAEIEGARLGACRTSWPFVAKRRATVFTAPQPWLARDCAATLATILCQTSIAGAGEGRIAAGPLAVAVDAADLACGTGICTLTRIGALGLTRHAHAHGAR